MIAKANPFYEDTYLLGTRVDSIKLNELIQYIMLIVREQKKVIVSNVNVHAINIAFKQEWFRNFINQSHIVFCDGYGVKWAAKFLYGKELHRLTPPDWFDALASQCSKQGFTMFFLGTHQEIVQKSAQILTSKYPELGIVGVHHGFFDKNPISQENIDVVERINAVHPNILIVGFGMPTQEKWILDNWDRLQVNVIIPVGAFFDYFTGEVTRAPRWMTDHGLEWLGRLIIEPRRLWKRYILGNPLFVARVLLEKIKSFT